MQCEKKVRVAPVAQAMGLKDDIRMEQTVAYRIMRIQQDQQLAKKNVHGRLCGRREDGLG